MNLHKAIDEVFLQYDVYSMHEDLRRDELKELVADAIIKVLESLPKRTVWLNPNVGYSDSLVYLSDINEAIEYIRKKTSIE